MVGDEAGVVVAAPAVGHTRTVNTALPVSTTRTVAAATVTATATATATWTLTSVRWTRMLPDRRCQVAGRKRWMVAVVVAAVAEVAVVVVAAVVVVVRTLHTRRRSWLQWLQPLVTPSYRWCRL